MKKKILAGILTVVMLCSFCLPAFAETITQPAPASGDVIILTDDTNDIGGGDPAKFSVTIPADASIVWGTTATKLSYTVESHLRRGQAVKVVVTGSANTDGNTYMKTTDGAYKLPYTLTGDTTFLATSPVVYAPATKDFTVNIAEADWNQAVVDTYKDTLTFAITIVE